LKHRIADLLLSLESCKSTTEAAINAIDEESPAAARLVSVAKSYVGNKSLHLISEAVQLHGGIGLTWEHDLHVYGRRAALNRAIYGTPEQHRERLCRLLEV
jgi:alkylation response protein AidB-like acyl-CoA dehydrogenase